MYNTHDILETIKMIEEEHLDIRTVTMGISLLDCIDNDIDKACEKVYRKITSCAADLIPVCEKIEKKYKNKTDNEALMAKSQETMMLYKKYNINPLSSCLFTFIQLPLFFAFLEKYSPINTSPIPKDKLIIENIIVIQL